MFHDFEGRAMEVAGRNPQPAPRAGFTLAEVVVALVLVGLLTGALVPSVLNQLRRGDTTRALEDLTAIEGAVRSFRVDVRRWPGDVEDLMEAPDLQSTPPADSALAGQGAYTPVMVSRWVGPYLERVTLGPDGNVASPIGGTILGRFATVDDQLAIELEGLDDDQVASLDAAVDNGDGELAGRIRWSGSSGAFTLQYLAVPLI